MCILFALLHSTVFGNPCKNYKIINDPYRSTKYEWVRGSKAICDHGLAAGYYRFNSSSGNMMPTVKPNAYHCGTYAPIWMNGKHPDPNSFLQFTQNSACIRYPDRDVCPDGFTITSVYCKQGNFYVYYLRGTYGCPMAYCAGKKEQYNALAKLRFHFVEYHLSCGMLTERKILFLGTVF